MTPNTIEVHSTDDNTWVMRITADRKIEVNEDVDVTFAAQKVLDALQVLLTPQRNPLTDEEIDAVMPQPTEFGIVQPPWNGLDITILRAMARAIEAAHDIKENT